MNEVTVGEIKEIYEMLEDDESKDIFMKRLNYTLTNNKQFMAEVVEKYVPVLGRKAHFGKNIAMLFETLPQGRSFVLYGAGNDAKRNKEYWINDSRFLGFCDKNKEKQEKDFLGCPVMSPEELFGRIREEKISVIISTHSYIPEIYKKLTDGGMEEGDIFVMAHYEKCNDRG